jgi:hypothetical protein
MINLRSLPASDRKLSASAGEFITEKFTSGTKWATFISDVTSNSMIQPKGFKLKTQEPAITVDPLRGYRTTYMHLLPRYGCEVYPLNLVYRKMVGL